MAVEAFKETLEFNPNTIRKRVQELSFLNPGVEFIVFDQRTEKRWIFLSKSGLEEYLNHLEPKNDIMEPIVVDGKAGSGQDTERTPVDSLNFRLGK